MAIAFTWCKKDVAARKKREPARTHAHTRTARGAAARRRTCELSRGGGARRARRRVPAKALMAPRPRKKTMLFSPISCSIRNVISVPSSTILVMNCQKRLAAEMVFTNR